MYSLGVGVPRDEAEAVRWYQLAAEQGYALVQSNLGVILAQRWYSYHVDAHGDVLAQANLGLAEQNLVFAYKWFTLAKAQGSETAQTNKGVIEQWLTREQIAEAQRLSQEWVDAHPQGGGEPSETIRLPGR